MGETRKSYGYDRQGKLIKFNKLIDHSKSRSRGTFLWGIQSFLESPKFNTSKCMVRNIENGSALIEKWLRNKNTIEFLGIWEEMYNPDFNSPEFEGIKNEAGSKVKLTY